MGLLSGLEQFGLGNLENVDLFDKQKKEEEKAAKRQKTPQEIELDILFDKTYKCPICDHEFKVRTVRNGKAKLLGSDLDLRPKYEHIDVLKYDVVLCTKCGYTALSRYFGSLTSMQAKLIKENITIAYKPKEDTAQLYTYDDAIGRYKMALVNSVVKRGKLSERAYICLKTAWILRGKYESLDKNDPDYEKTKIECVASEMEFLKNAYEGFMEARQKESFPMCGMDDMTLDYLLAVIAIRFDQLDVASRLVSGIISIPNAPTRIKEKAKGLKEIIVKKKTEGKANVNS